MQENHGACIFGDGEANRIACPLGWNALALAGIAYVAELPQLMFIRHVSTTGFAGTAEAGAERKPSGKRPGDGYAFLGGEKIRTSHESILVLIRAAVIDFFDMSETNRLEMLAQFLEQNPNDAFARYGLALEYSKLGQTDVALQHFNRLLEIHPDYTNGYFMAAQTLAKVERNDEARAMLQKGIESAQRTGNRHALNEMSAMLDELS